MKAIFRIVRQPLFWAALFRLVALSQASAQDKVGMALQVAEGYLHERNPQSEVIVQAVQRINNKLTARSNARSHTFQA